ncbi:efflux RND transporter periplasmic adaptor subunit [Sulfurimonas sp.]
MKTILLTLMVFLSTLHAKDIYATFNVEAQKSANLAFTASGLVKNTSAEIGSSVKKGEVLASLDNADIQALLTRAKTVYKYAKRSYERQLKIKNLIDEGKFDTVAKAYESAKSSLAYQQAMYNKTFLKAPFDGVIFYKDIEVGDAVSGLMLKTVYKIQSATKRKLLITFDEKYANIVKVGDTFEYMVDGDTKTYTGTIRKIYPQANTKNRKITAEVQAKNFMVGLFGTGTIHTK